jgi:hypothetical protein
MAMKRPSNKCDTKHGAAKYSGTKKCKRGRPIKSHSVQVVPVFRDEIDVKKLGRAALRLAMELEETDEQLKEARKYGIDDGARDNETK